MPYASEDLRKEHDGVLFGLRILEQMAEGVKRTGQAEVADLAEMINFFRLFADKCHHGKEEGLLFPAMEKAGIPVERGPIGQMLLEHTQGRQFIAEMAAAIAGGTLQAERFTAAANGYIELMRAHIEKENEILFPMGDRTLPMDEQQELLERFEGFEEEVMGVGTHERLHVTLDKFQQKYLKQA